MTEFSPAHAFLLAASEVVPADARDLSALLRQYDSVESFAESEVMPPGRLGYLADHVKRSVESHRVTFWRRRLEELRMKWPSVQFHSVVDASYPVNLRSAYDCPPFVFTRGSVLQTDMKALAIVGSRRTSSRVIDAAATIASQLACAGVTVVSGLALGVDAAAHRGALEGGGRTLAVLGHGIDQVQPASNRELAGAVEAKGALISQFRPFSPPTSSSFPLRNAVISGLAQASLIMDAAERSGTRSEAEASLRQGRPVLLWGPALGDQAWARNFARQDNVRMVESFEEVTAAMTGGSSGAQLEFPE